MTKEPLVLVIDDESSIRQFLTINLKSRGFACEEVSSAGAALSLVSSLNPDLILLDLGLPDGDGKALVPEIRKITLAPILVISARDQEQEKVLALEVGADDYLTKPFGLDELVARLKVALRHQKGLSESTELQRQFGSLTWDLEAHRLYHGKQEIHLTPLEYRLFSYMALHPGRILTHGTLLREVWGLSSSEMFHYVRIATSSLRRKLEKDPGRPEYIHTEVGTGYRFFE